MTGLYVKFISLFQYPVLMSESVNGSTSSIHQYCTGLNSFDEICCSSGMSTRQVDDQVERDPNVILIWK